MCTRQKKEFCGWVGKEAEVVLAHVVRLLRPYTAWMIFEERNCPNRACVRVKTRNPDPMPLFSNTNSTGSRSVFTHFCLQISGRRRQRSAQPRPDARHFMPSSLEVEGGHVRSVACCPGISINMAHRFETDASNTLFTSTYICLNDYS